MLYVGASNKRRSGLVLAIKRVLISYFFFFTFIFMFTYSKPSSSYALRAYSILHLVVLPSVSDRDLLQDDLKLYEPILFVCFFKILS